MFPHPLYSLLQSILTSIFYNLTELWIFKPQIILIKPGFFAI